jgi:hypothetical protein
MKKSFCLAAAAAWLAFGMILLHGCSNPPDSYYYSIARKTYESENFLLTVTLVRRFEKKSWCEANSNRLTRDGLEAECRHKETQYDPMFRGEVTGKWYVHQSMGRFSPSILIYESVPPLPDEIMIEQLKQSAPHILQFAALHRMPAQVRIFSPTGEIPRDHKK